MIRIAAKKSISCDAQWFLTSISTRAKRFSAFVGAQAWWDRAATCSMTSVSIVAPRMMSGISRQA